MSGATIESRSSPQRIKVAPPNDLTNQCCARHPKKYFCNSIDPGCVKTLEAVVSAQQKKRTRGLGESFMRERHSIRINLAPERPADWFSHSQDPKQTFTDFASLCFLRACRAPLTLPSEASRSPAPQVIVPQGNGRMFWFKWKKFSGSYFALSCRSRL